MENNFLNKVDASGIVAIDLLDLKPIEKIAVLDIKDYLFMGLIVKEKEFRESVSAIDFTKFKDKIVAVICSADAILPPWIFMLIAEKIFAYTENIYFDNPEKVLENIWLDNLKTADLTFYKDKKVVVRARAEITPALYLSATLFLKPLVKTLMYGEIGMPKVIFKN
ncbi:DUF2480 family protein [Chryseobacterium sp. 5_R23647]|jgi:hypothetical protein|uniref:DUF2480 family protein n=1 Tax=Chryseobacterium sp. 5_R23647 TaxID=2258964 RepID=UPI000E264D7C|nr:DUF2480 family protein [Chryseobacterium sp. 5_R23647]REC44295.1 hypothetical protein DRF69_05065 [Chryseobacterium sp. 5_R23647]